MKNNDSLKLKRLWVLVLLPIGIIITGAARSSAAFCKFYTDSVYPFMSGTLNYLFSMTEISVAQIIIISFAVFIAFYTLVTILSLIFRPNRLKKLLYYAINLVCIFSIIFFFFSLTCGINYYRPSFAEEEGIITEKSTSAELAGLFEDLTGRLNEAKAQFTGNPRSFRSNAELARDYMQTLAEKYPSLSGDYGAPKAVNFFGWMSFTKITGFFFPFTYEANVNDTAPAVSLPATMCHELVHLRGHMREDEANYIAYLACTQSGDPEFVYSGLLLAYSHTSSALYAEDPQAYRDISEKLDDAVKKDIADKNEYWKKYDGVVAEISDTVNDAYLKANDRKDGVKSYGKMVDLLLAEYRQKLTAPANTEEQNKETNNEG
jgi:hypothetical protein